jgi:cyclase
MLGGRDGAEGRNVFHTRGTIFLAGYPHINLASGGHIDGIIAAAAKVIALANDSSRIIPGHGPLSTKKDPMAYRQMLNTIRARHARAAARPAVALPRSLGS